MNNEVAFVQVPKTGSVSIHRVVKDWCVEITHLKSESRTAAGFKREHPDGYIFAFVRNPFDRLVSAYFYFKMSWNHPDERKDVEKYINPYKDFREFVLVGIGEGKALEQTHCRPQVSWITDEQGNVVVDFLGHYERLQVDFNAVCRRFGWPLNELEMINKSRHKPYGEYYDAEMERVVARAYARDFEVGEYEMTIRRDA